MRLSPGTRLASYEVIAAIGAGGMGEVYRARDTTLNRNVALKILPDAVAVDPDRLARFRREAQALAALNHPNIAQIYSFEDLSSATAGQPGAMHVLVMELIEGEDLSEMIRSNFEVRTSKFEVLERALPIARQIASALEAAHEQGIVHRDLKPANVMITADGTVKVLDFGLAKALGPERAGPTADTVTSPAMTEMGIVLGTAGYMAPEQARGKVVDRRADIWALGVVLFELIARRPLYRGETVTDTIAQLLTQPPAWDALPATTPASIRRLLRRCLEKDPRNRFQSAGDVRIEIEECLASPDSEVTPVAAPRARTKLWRQLLPWSIATALLVGLVVSRWPRPPAAPQVFRADVRLGDGEELRFDDQQDGALAVLSPDGQTLAYAGTSSAVRKLFVRPLALLESKPLSGTEDAMSPFFSPDGRWLGFFSGGMLRRVALKGGPPVPIAEAADARGGSWGPNDVIVFTPSTVGGLWRVPASGGPPVELTHPQGKERSHRWPSFLPDGRAVLFMCEQTDGSYDDGTIEAVRLDTGERTVITTGTFPRYVASGQLVFTRKDELFAMPFDPVSLKATGEAQPVIGGITSSGGVAGDGASQIAFADNGTAAYLAGPVLNLAVSRLAVVDRHGTELSSFPQVREFGSPRFSPVDERIAVQVGEGTFQNVYVLDGTKLTKMTFEKAFNASPVWSPDGRQIAYVSFVFGKGSDIFTIRSNGGGVPERLTNGGPLRVPSSFSHRGTSLLAAMEQDPATSLFHLIVLSLPGKQVTPFVGTSPNETMPMFSWDDKWIAYQSGEAAPDTARIFVRAYPSGDAKGQVSPEVGRFPFWTKTKNGKEIVYSADTPGTPGKTDFLAVEVTVDGDALRFGPPTKLFDKALAVPLLGVPYGVSDDGNRFAVLLADRTTADLKQTHVTVVLNFFEDIKHAVAVDHK